MKQVNLKLNAYYIYLYRQNRTNEFLDSKYPDDILELISENDKFIAETMTEHEEEEKVRWNEGGFVDYESAMTKLIELFDCNLPKNDYIPYDFVRWCNTCGMPMDEGFLLGGYYACSDNCRNQHYKDYYGAKDDEEAEKFYYLECHEIGDISSNLLGCFTDEDKEKYDIDKRPSEMSLDELKSFIIEHDLEIGDYVFYTEWFI